MASKVPKSVSMSANIKQAYNRIDDCLVALKWFDANKDTFKGKCYRPMYFNLDDKKRDKIMCLLIREEISDEEKEMMNHTLAFQFELNTDHHIFARQMWELEIVVNSEVLDFKD
uniref:Uncharacterized protein n=1 Tax=Clytia hemisphaerica TaxID=252671 RepID=A0A7M5VEZ7_9CNID